MSYARLFGMAAIVVAGALNALALGLALYIIIDLRVHPTCMPIQVICIPPGLAIAGSSIVSWIVVFRKVRGPSGDRLPALAWGASSGLIAALTSFGIWVLVFWMTAYSWDLRNAFALLATVLIPMAGGILLGPMLVLRLRRRRQSATD